MLFPAGYCAAPLLLPEPGNVRHTAPREACAYISFRERLFNPLQNTSNSIYTLPGEFSVSLMTVNRRFPGRLREDLFTGTDLVKMIVILSFSAVSFMLTVIAPDYGIYPANSLIYCIPILLAALWYPGQGFRVTALLVAGFALIRIYFLTLGFAIDPVMTGLNMLFFFWVFGATVLFSQDPYLTISRCRQVVENTRDARLLCDPETLRVLCVSRRCADILGYAPTELIGIPVEKFWPDESERARFIAEMKREGYIGNMEATFRTRNGDARAVLISCRSLAGENLVLCTVVDIGGHAALVQENGRLMELIHQSNDIFFMQDVAGRILHFSWLRAPEYGISPEGLIGQGVDALLSADLAREHAARLQDVVEGQKSACYDINLELAGTRHVFSITMAPYYGVDGTLIGVAGSARDITEVWRQRLACRQMALEIDLWKGLVATLSHELRTPLQPLIGHLQMVVEDPGYYGLSEEAKGPLEACLACARQEQAAVEKMVGFGLLAADSVELVIQSVPLRSLVDSIISSGGYDREAEFCNDISETASLRGDRDRLYEVIETLVSNAVKYNEPPKKVWASYTESNRNHYITVCDNGIGISADAVESIFGPFSTGGTEQPNRERRQTDPGLSIANKYVRLHGGDITVRSVVGEGSTFTIRIPKEV